MIINRLCLLLLIILSGTFSLCAQNRSYSTINYTTDNGLPQNSVTAICFDRKGYCWLGTELGLVRFDGRHFKVFGAGEIKGLKSERIRSVITDRKGQVFVQSGNIFQHLWIDDTSSVSAPFPRLYTSGDLWIPGQLGYVNQATVKKINSKFTRGLGGVSGNEYFDRSDSVFYFSAGKTRFIATGKGLSSDLQLLIGDLLITFTSGTKMEAWNKGIKQPQLQSLQGPVATNPFFRSGKFITVITGDQNYIYAGKTLYKVYFENGDLQSRVIFDDLDIPLLSGVYYNKEQNKYYLGSLVSGLFVVTPHEFKTPALPKGALELGFYSQSATEAGILSQRFLFRKDGTSRAYPLKKYLTSGFYKNGGSFYYAPDTKLLKADLATGKEKLLLQLDTRLSSLFRDQEDSNTLVFSTSYSLGKLHNDSLMVQKKIPGLGKGSEIFCVYPNGKDSFLVATWSGIKWYDFKSNRIYRSVLDSLNIRILYVESPQRFWIASYGRGFYLYDSGQVYSMPDGPVNALKTVNAFIDDRRGFFWITSNNGLFKVSKQSLIAYAKGTASEVYFYTFTMQDNLPSNEFNACNPSYLWLQDSMLSLPTIKGLAWFYPHRMHLLLPDKGIYLDRVAVDNAAVTMSLNHEIVLQPYHRQLVLEISSPYFGNKENIKLRYRMADVIENWQPVPENGLITIDRIPRGHYRLEISKATGWEPDNYAAVNLEIRVLPKIYATWPFWAVLTLFLGAVFYLVLRLRTRLLLERNEKLQLVIATQTKALQSNVKRLSESEAELKESNQTKDNMITTVLHDLRSPIRFLQVISGHIVTRHKEMPQAELQEKLSEMHNGMASLNAFTEQFFTWAASQHRHFKISCSWVNIQTLFEEAAIFYSDIVRSNGNRLIIEPTVCRCFSDPQILATIIRNLLDNANKNTKNGNITLAATDNREVLAIKVADSGTGFTAATLDSFLNNEMDSRKDGNGSFIIHYLLGLIDARLEGCSEPGQGTTFTILIAGPESSRSGKPPDSVQ